MLRRWLRSRPRWAACTALAPPWAATLSLVQAGVPAVVVSLVSAIQIGFVCGLVLPRQVLPPDLTGTWDPDERLAVKAVIATGRPTGDPRLDRTARAVLLRQAAGERRAARYAVPIGLVLLAVPAASPVLAAVLVSQWWLLAELGWAAASLAPARQAPRPEPAADRLARFEAAA